VNVPYHGDVLGATLTLVGPKAGATDGDPIESILELSDDGRVSTGIWACTPGSFPSAREGYSEVMTFVAGDATITDDDGTEHPVAAGTTIVLNDGWRGRWTIRETVRKVYVIAQSG
jgi:uncharacterized protein